MLHSPPSLSHISTSAARFGLEIARIGAKREIVFSKEGVRGGKQSVPANASSDGCGWPAALKIPIAKDWMYYAVAPFSVLLVTALSLLELFIAGLQAFIFTFLTAVFIGLAKHPPH